MPRADSPPWILCPAGRLRVCRNVSAARGDWRRWCSRSDVAALACCFGRIWLSGVPAMIAVKIGTDSVVSVGHEVVDLGAAEPAHLLHLSGVADED
jgi:hypothetical protein